MSRNRSRRWNTTREIIEELGFEDLAINYLAKLPHAISVITSVRVAREFADLWDIERTAMNNRDDPRLVYHVTDREREWLASATAVSSKDPIWRSCPHEEVGKLFGSLPPDVAARVAYRVARWACWMVEF